MLKISLTPQTCSCPNTSYTCEVDDATEIRWATEYSNQIFVYTENSLVGQSLQTTDNFQVTFTRTEEGEYHNFTSTLHVTNLDQNGTNLTCLGHKHTSTIKDTIRICIIGIQDT